MRVFEESCLVNLEGRISSGWHAASDLAVNGQALMRAMCTEADGAGLIDRGACTLVVSSPRSPFVLKSKQSVSGWSVLPDCPRVAPPSKHSSARRPSGARLRGHGRPIFCQPKARFPLCGPPSE
eukprot:364378-Chlamydomonas_euryale.AAC.9